MPSSVLSSFKLRTLLRGATAVVCLGATVGLQAQSGSAAPQRVLPTNTRFYVPPPAAGSTQQMISLLRAGDTQDAVRLGVMEITSQAVWLAGGTPAQVSATVGRSMQAAARSGAVPVFVLYNIPGRDCGSYSAGGAQTTADYEAWIDAVAAAIGDGKAVLAVEPDALANLPSDCGYDPTKINVQQATADRYAQINYGVTALEAKPQAFVYLDAGNSNWHAVGDMTVRLLAGGLGKAQGFFSNVSNFQSTENEAKFDGWISACLAFGSNAQDGGWRLGHYDYCASQYYSPLGPVDPNNYATWVYSDEWYQQNLGNAVASTHFVIDTSRNGQGPLPASVYSEPPYNQSAPVVQTLTNGRWCNPPGRGLGLRPTANTGVPLLDAYLWVKTPGQSDGTCDAQGGARAWDYSIYTQPGWPTTTAGQALFDPLWGLVDPAAGAWFPQQTLDLAKHANPAILP